MIPPNLVFSKKISSDIASYLSSTNFPSVAVLCDENTNKFCYPIIKSSLPKHYLITIPPGEENKNLDGCTKIWKEMTKSGLDRKSLMINLGGGVIGDMGGFCASVFKRGIEFINLPTTLLSQVDASIGGKLGIDFLTLKNHLGVFKEPLQTFVNPEFLYTLPERELRSGFAEIIKHCLIADKEFFNKIIEIGYDRENWDEIILHSIKVKYRITQQDPLEKGLRKVLNFGHTVGHALESHYLESSEKLYHGEAIAIGMICEAYISHMKELLNYQDLELISQQIVRYFGLVKIDDKAIGKVCSLVKHDKKNVDNTIMCTLLKGIGTVLYDQEIDVVEIKESLIYYRNLNKE